jgi:hypothetical protein
VQIWQEVGRSCLSRVGNGVTLGKQGKTDKAAVNKEDGADEATIVQAKLIWLI